ncbi:MAG: NTP transferase domain-containing protein [Oscillospiraceae bacterium]|jgi:mannose-1-phosphate guanylyltransferase/phosphomannomutase|nr:NTP transferase domain-containing protein [Oscillospiraceae bacterium]
MRTVILAGGEGTRLRPLTCDIPKPMARLCGKPILEYLFDGLLRAGINSAALTLGYLPQVIEEAYRGGYGDMAPEFIREEEPLGTAGSVRNALGDSRESAFVLSGDALCNYDFAEILRSHKASGASVTIVALRVDDPREYGLLRTDSAGFVKGFIEKPGWSQAVGGLANTGIYVLEPDALERIPLGRQYDFAKDLFPLLLREGKAIHCHAAPGYWCDVGDISTLLHASRDMLDSEQMFLQDGQDGIFGTRPMGNYTIKPPVYFGENVHIDEGAVLGPYTVFEDGASVGAGAKVRRSILMPGAVIEANSRVTGSLLCHDALVRRGASLFEGSVLGAGAVAGEDSSVEPGVRIWPGQRVEVGYTVRENLQYGGARREIFGDFGLDAGGRLTPRFCAALGTAMASVPECRRAGIAHDGSPRAKSLARALSGGLQYGGASVWDFGESFPAQAEYCAAFSGRSFSVFVRGNTLLAAGEGALPLPRGVERAIEAALERAQEHPAQDDQIRDTADMSNIRAAYRQELRRQTGSVTGSELTGKNRSDVPEGAPLPLAGLSVGVEGTNPLPREILRETLQDLGCDIFGGRLTLRLNASGGRVGAWTRETGQQPFEKLLALCCLNEFRHGHSLALPSDAPLFLDTLARQNGCTLMRYLHSPSDGSDAAARKAAQSTPWTRDGLFLAVRLLAIMSNRGMSLAELLAELPTVHVRQSFAHGNPSRLAELSGKTDLEPLDAPEGFLLRKGLGRLLILPGKGGRRLRILAEAESMETAAELAAEAEAFLAIGN